MMGGLVIGVTARGEIVPPPGVLRRLHEISPRLGLKHFPSGGHTEWAITLDWPPEDPRHDLVNRGIAGEPRCDVEGWVPFDCREDDIPGWVERQLQRSSKEAVRRLAADARRHNEALAMARLDTAFAEVENAAEVLGPRGVLGDDKRVARVSMAEPRGRVRRRGVRPER
jgi:hypothetical protein